MQWLTRQKPQVECSSCLLEYLKQYSKKDNKNVPKISIVF